MVKADKWQEKIEKELEIAKEKGQVPDSFIELVSELRIHQSELEMQNEELKQSQEELSELYNQYHELYDEAPVGYFTLDKDMIIRNVNVKGAELLQLNKSKIIGRGFSRFIPKDCENRYYHALANAVNTSENQKIELQFKRNDTLFDAQMEIMPLYERNDGEYRIVITDITESKKTEDAKQEANRNYQSLFNNKSMGIAHCKTIFNEDNEPADYVILNVNDTYERLTGLKKAELINKRITEAVPGVEQSLIDLHNRVAVTGEDTHFEIYEPNLNHWYDVTVYSPQKGYFIAIFTNITERKKAEEALKESEDRFRAFVKSSSDVVYRMSSDWTKMLQLRGRKFIPDTYSPSKTWMDKYIHPDDQPYVQEVINEAIRTKSIFELEHRVLQVDGTVGWTFSRAVPMLDTNGEIIEWFGTAKDITDRKKAEEALRESLASKSKILNALKESNKKYSSLFNSTSDGVWIHNLKGEIIEVNDAYCNMSGYTRDEILGNPISKLEAVESPQEVKKHIKKVVESNGHDRFESKHRRKDGSIFDVDITALYFEKKKGNIAIFVRDITEHKKAEEGLIQTRENLEEEIKERAKELHNERQRLFDVLETLPIQICLLKPDYHVTFANQAFRKVYDDVYSRPCYEFAFGYKEPCEFCESFKPLETDEPHYWQVKIPNGMIIDIYDFPFTDVDGSKLILEMDIDVTEQKQVEKELKLASAYNRSLIEASLDPLVTIGSDGKITDINTATELVTGYSRNELIGTDFSNYFTETQKAQYGYQKVFREGEVRDYSLEIKHKKGHVTPVLYNASTYKDESGEVIGVFAAARNITELKKSEDAIEAERQRLNDLMEIMPAYLVLLTPDYHVPFANRFFRERFGESGGKRCFEYLFGFDKPCENCETYKVLKTDAPHHWEWTGPDGRNYDIYDFPFKDTDGSPLIMEFGIDITKRKKAEKQLKIIIEELKRSNKELQSFAYITSHDLQEPLRTIASFTQLLEMRYKGQLDDDADEFMDYIVKAAVRMKDMIQGLLEYSRIDSQSEPFKEFESEEAVNHALIHLHSSIEECNAEITHDNLPLIIGDEHQIVRIFQNLIGNALKFRKEEVKPEIHISSRKNEGEYIFSVSDNGIGMEKQYSKKIFEPFKRIHTIDAYEGTGIGLSVVKRIIEHHGGRIWFESELGVGSTFYFTIPVEPVKTGGAFS